MYFWVINIQDFTKVVAKYIQENSKVLSIEKFNYISYVPSHASYTLKGYLFYYKNQDFLVVVEYFSKFLIVRKVPNCTTETVMKGIQMCRAIAIRVR